MKLIQSNIIKRTDKRYKEIIDLCHRSKNLYNASLYEIRRQYFNDKTYLPYARLDKYFKETNNIDYRSLPSQTAQQTMRMVDQNFKSFFKLVKKEGCKAKIPHYKDKNGVYIVIFTSQQISKKSLKNGVIKIPGLECTFKTQLSSINQIRFIPQTGCIKMEIVFEVEDVNEFDDNGIYMGVDLGVNNLATITSNNGLCEIVNGRPLKSINQYYNKKKAKYQSINKKIDKLTFKRNNKVNDYLHKASRYIMNQAVSNKINTIIVGLNKGWKQDINMGTINNQKFVTIPHSRFINMLKYKCKMEGIRFIVREESYTSKASFLNFDYIPNIKENKNHIFSGKRIKRGLYVSDKGMINADVNGSLNILRKEIGDDSFPTDIGFVFNPRRINIF